MLVECRYKTNLIRFNDVPELPERQILLLPRDRELSVQIGFSDMRLPPQTDHHQFRFNRYKKYGEEFIREYVEI